MTKYLIFIVVVFMSLLVSFEGFSQNQDTTKVATIYAGSVGITNNGFSIIPTFSLNSPAITTFLSWKKKQFSIDPDVRLALTGKKGSILLWFRYYPIQREKWKLRVGMHPALNLQLREIVENGVTTQISQARRFIAFEANPSYRINKKLTVGLYYLQGNGLQKNGARTSHFVNINMNASKIKLVKNYQLNWMPAFYYLYLDAYEGIYFTSTVGFSNTKSPISIQSSINKTMYSNIPANKDFLWNVAVLYNFSHKLQRIDK
jgi:hypothetical protein